jgi:hypothetical protein
MKLQHRSDRELLSDVAKLIGSHRLVTAKLVAYLAEIEERRLHLQAGFSSMFDYCVRKLQMSEGEAFRRIVAARLGRRLPLVYSLLASGGCAVEDPRITHRTAVGGPLSGRVHRECRPSRKTRALPRPHEPRQSEPRPRRLWIARRRRARGRRPASTAAAFAEADVAGDAASADPPEARLPRQGHAMFAAIPNARFAAELPVGIDDGDFRMITPARASRSAGTGQPAAGAPVAR